MDLGSDTFPRDEVTGLAAFEHLDPISTVSTLNMMPEPPAPAPRILTPPPPPPAMSRMSSVPQAPRTGMTLPPPPPGAARTFSRPPQPSAAARPTPTLPPPAAVPMGMRADATENVELDNPSWDDPEEAATRVHAGAPAAELHMDWDDEEPPTQMRGEGGVGITTIQDTARGVALDWDDENIDTRLRDVDGETADTSAYQPAGDSGRPSPFPSRTSVAPYAAPVAAAAAVDLEEPYGAPSPFASETAWGQDLRGGDRRTQLWIAAAALGIIVLAFGVRAMFAKEPAGLVTLATVPADARVLVDGKPVAGTSSPFSATDLAPGVPHELTVERAGYVTQRTTFSVEGGEAKTLSTVALVASNQASGFAIDSVPGGAQIKVDGELVGLSTPARVTQVSTGLHKVELVREGYAPYQVQVFVPDGQVLELPAATLSASTLGSAAAARDDDAPAKAAVESAPAVSTRSESSAHQRHKARRAARRASGSSRATVARAPRVTTRAAARPKAVVAAPAAGKGVLRVNSRPWAQVFVDGRMVGNTPQMGLQLAAGKHTIKLVNPQMGLKKQFTITTKAGQTETKVLNLIE